MKRAGTSLIELMIALVVLAAFASTMTVIIVNNSKSDESNDARREARGVARSAINLLESEVRMAEPDGVIAPTNDSTITYRQPFAFGLVCANTGGNVTIAMLPSADLPSNLTVSGYTGWAYRDTTGTYQYQPNTTIASGTAATCTGALHHGPYRRPIRAGTGGRRAGSWNGRLPLPSNHILAADVDCTARPARIVSHRRGQRRP